MKSMKSPFRALVCATLVAGGLAAGIFPAAASVAPDFALSDLEGGKVRLSEAAADRPVLIVFWATWCGYCRREIPKLNDLRNRYTSSQLEILAVDLQEDPVDVKRFVRKSGIRYRVLADVSGTTASAYGINGIPFFVLVGKGGGVEFSGHQISDRLINRIETVLESGE